MRLRPPEYALTGANLLWLSVCKIEVGTFAIIAPSKHKPVSPPVYCTAITYFFPLAPKWNEAIYPHNATDFTSSTPLKWQQSVNWLVGAIRLYTSFAFADGFRKHLWLCVMVRNTNNVSDFAVQRKACCFSNTNTAWKYFLPVFWPL